MLIRFQGKKQSTTSATMLGIFQLAFDLRDNGELPSFALEELNKNLGWLKMHLYSPNTLKERENFRAISWFRDSAKEPLKRIWAIKAILEEYGYPIDMIKTSDPGHVIFEDGWQVVAKPRRKKQIKNANT